MMNLTGIPGTVSDKVKPIQWIRQPDIAVPGGTGRKYIATTKDGYLVAIVSHDEVEPGKRLWHLSVSHSGPDLQPDRCPDWSELKFAAYRLLQMDRPFVLIFPRRTAEYVDVHPTCLHVWESQEDIDLDR